jgi:hypothetical protein
MPKNDQIPKLFAERTPNPDEGGKVVWKGSGRVNRTTGPAAPGSLQIFCEDDVLYSYGRHWPVARYLGLNRCGGNVFVKNSDFFSATTRQHYYTASAVCPGPTVSRKAFEAAGFDFTEVTVAGKNASDGGLFVWREGVNDYIYRDEAGNLYADAWDRTPYTPPDHGSFVPSWRKPDDGLQAGTWYSPEISVWRQKWRFFVCSVIDGHRFLAEIDSAPADVDDALKSVVPAEVVEARKAGLEVPQIGHWYFIPVSATDSHRSLFSDREMEKMAKVNFLPNHLTGDRTLYVAKIAQFMAGPIWVTGKVYHRNRSFVQSQRLPRVWGELSGKHKAINLEGWHAAVAMDAHKVWWDYNC